MNKQIIQVTTFDLTSPAAEVQEKISTLSQAVKEKGSPGVVRYSIYVNPNTNTGGSTIIFDGIESWKEQHELVPQLPEYQAFSQSISLTGLRFSGDLGEEIKEWLAQHGAVYEDNGDFVAGFSR